MTSISRPSAERLRHSGTNKDKDLARNEIFTEEYLVQCGCVLIFKGHCGWKKVKLEAKRTESATKEDAKRRCYDGTGGKRSRFHAVMEAQTQSLSDTE